MARFRTAGKNARRIKSNATSAGWVDTSTPLRGGLNKTPALNKFDYNRKKLQEDGKKLLHS